MRNKLCHEPDPAAPCVLSLDAVLLSGVCEVAAGGQVSGTVRVQAGIVRCDGPWVALILLANSLQVCSARQTMTCADQSS